jgi:Tol biopolymer transport system component
MKWDGTLQTRITHEAAIDNGPQWSPNGPEILFNSGRSGTFNMWKMAKPPASSPVAPGAWSAPIPLTGAAAGHPETEVGSWGKWSPDGSMIVFGKGNPNRGLYVMNADGSNPRWLVQNVFIFHCDWSPVTTVSRLAYGTTVDDHVYVVDLSGSTVEDLAIVATARLTFDLASEYRPSFSPDGTQIAIEAGGGIYGVFVGSGLPGSAYPIIPKGKGSLGGERPAWKSHP